MPWNVFARNAMQLFNTEEQINTDRQLEGQVRPSCFVNRKNLYPKWYKLKYAFFLYYSSSSLRSGGLAKLWMTENTIAGSAAQFLLSRTSQWHSLEGLDDRIECFFKNLHPTSFKNLVIASPSSEFDFDKPANMSNLVSQKHLQPKTSRSQALLGNPILTDLQKGPYERFHTGALCSMQSSYSHFYLIPWPAGCVRHHIPETLCISIRGHHTLAFKTQAQHSQKLCQIYLEGVLSPNFGSRMPGSWGHSPVRNETIISPVCILLDGWIKSCHCRSVGLWYKLRRMIRTEYHSRPRDC